jgi:hypothetical protein
VEGWKDNSLVLEKVVLPAIRQPDRSDAVEAEERLSIAVIYTSVESTLAALKKAGALASSLGARITLLAPQVVPFPLPLESPPILLDWNEQRFRDIASQSPVETTVRLYLCRDSNELLASALPPKSLVIVGGPKTFWPVRREKRLAAKLRRAGHQVIFTETE